MDHLQPSRRFITQTLGTALALVAILLIYQLSQLLLLVFGSIIFASLLVAASQFLEKYTPIGRMAGLAIVLILVAVSIGGFLFVFGSQIQAQVMALIQTFPSMISSVGHQVGIPDLWDRLGEQATQILNRGGVFGSIAGYTSNVVTALSGGILILVAGAYLAVDPDLYKRGFVTLFPRESRKHARAALDHSGEALKLWLLGQLLTMLFVGVATTIGLFIIGVPSALTLGILAGLLEFIPYFGPILSAIPAILVALSVGDTTVYWVMGLYLLIQQIENNVVVPLVQRQTVDLPPVLGLFVVLALGLLFGPLGFLFGMPLTVVIFVMVKLLYVREVLEEPVDVPGDDAE
ncbi:putative PurR-regulated permease PerM [Rhodoligotrophos appendicifer]|uniref:AI-2E family transporter n=1 Tax=Rhodoligotrophos appendicifer TaxID=987056 RepID=UPI0014794905|nr:AI-2E family transporter [Rhodoligotrophos appendicifer]